MLALQGTVPQPIAAPAESSTSLAEGVS